MTAEFEIFKKDFIKLNIYKEVVADRSVLLEFFLDGNLAGTDYFENIHDENIVMNRYGCFNISEDKVNNCITIRPALIKFSMKISIICQQPFVDKKALTIYRDGNNNPETSFDITNNCESIELIPSNDKYIMKINYSGNIPTESTADTQQAETPTQPENTQETNTQENATQTAVPQSSENNTSQTPTAENKADSKNENTDGIPQQKLDAIKAESEKDYEQYVEKLETIKDEYKFDKSVIEYYKDHDLVPIEKIFAELDEKIKSAEEQIKLFVEARQNKTKEIEE